MGTKGGLPPWLLESKENVTKSKEWNSFVEELYDAIQQQLRESHVGSFTDLTDAERTLFMERAAKAIHGGNAHRDLYSKVSVCLDQHLNNEVARQLLEDYPVESKTDLILDAAQDGAVSILKRWPDMRSKLHIHLNQPLSKSLRQLAWRLFLENSKVRKVYVDILNSNPRSAISAKDLEISQQCEQLIISEPTFADIKGSIGSFYAMKAVLSYYHTVKRVNANLADTEYLLAVPFIYCVNHNISRKEPAANHIVALLVEEFLTFMASRPGFVADTGSELHNTERKAFNTKVANHLTEKAPDVATIIAEAYAPSKEKIVATDTSTKALLSEGIRNLIRPVIRAMFVGYLKMDVVLFIWDQYMIGSDIPGFHDEYLPAVMAIFLILLKDNLRNCSMPSEMEWVLKKDGPNLKLQQFQYDFHKYFYKELYAVLNHGDKAALPVLDPTQAMYPPWIHWFSDRVPKRTTPQDRHQAREAREEERKRLERQNREEERRNREAEDKIRREEEARLKLQAANLKQRNEEDRNQMEAALDIERRRREDAERRAQDEIERLRREIEMLKSQPKRLTPPQSAISLDSIISRYLIPPPNTPRIGSTVTTTRPSPVPTPRISKAKTPKPDTDDVLLTFLKRVSASFNRIGHGEGNERRDLDEETKEDILEHKDDVKKAEVEVFGRQLRPGEFSELPSAEQAEKADDLMDCIKRLIEERRQQEIDEQSTQGGGG